MCIRDRFNALTLGNNLIYGNFTHFWHVHSFVLKLQKLHIVLSVPFPLQLLRVTSIYWVRLKKQILETPTIVIASFKQVMTNMCTLFVALLRKGKVCNKRLPRIPLWKLLAQRKTAKYASMRILRIIAYLSMQELLLLMICPSHSIHQWEVVCTL